MHLPDVMAANAASAALMLTDIPWGGPIAAIRVGRISGQFVINPTLDEVWPFIYFHGASVLKLFLDL